MLFVDYFTNSPRSFHIASSIILPQSPSLSSRISSSSTSIIRVSTLVTNAVTFTFRFGMTSPVIRSIQFCCFLPSGRSLVKVQLNSWSSRLTLASVGSPCGVKRTVHCRSFTEPPRLAPRTNGNQLFAFFFDRYGGPVRTHLPDGFKTIVKYRVNGGRVVAIVLCYAVAFSAFEDFMAAL